MAHVVLLSDTKLCVCLSGNALTMRLWMYRLSAVWDIDVDEDLFVSGSCKPGFHQSQFYHQTYHVSLNALLMRHNHVALFTLAACTPQH